MKILNNQTKKNYIKKRFINYNGNSTDLFRSENLHNTRNEMNENKDKQFKLIKKN